MKRRNGTGRFGNPANFEEEINPMDGLANLSDVMLVFACGLMLALITYWNVDVGSVSANSAELTQGTEISEMQGLDGNGTPLDGDSQFVEYGTVYRDENGNLYMVTSD